MITRMDRNVGRIFEMLKQSGIDEETIVFFTSDNGPSGGQGAPDFFNASGGLGGLKSSLYEGGILVPFIFRWPGKIKAGSVSDHICYFADMMPTIAELGQARAPRGIDGISILPTLFESGGQKNHKYLYWELGKNRRALRMGRYKAIKRGRKKGDEIELYDLRADPAEQNNIAGRRPEITAKAQEYLERARTKPRPQKEQPRAEGEFDF